MQAHKYQLFLQVHQLTRDQIEPLFTKQGILWLLDNLSNVHHFYDVLTTLTCLINLFSIMSRMLI